LFISSDDVTIGAEAFYGCPSLASVTISSNIITFKSDAFSQCFNLTLLTISSEYVTIGDYAFSRCTSLAEVTYLGKNAPQCSSNAFTSPFSGSICVSFEYNSSSFCANSVALSQTVVDQFNNHCFEIVSYCTNGTVNSQKRTNASEWESIRSNCAEFICVNESGGLFRDFCKENNTQQNCFNLTCQGNGLCSNVSLYKGCIDNITCGPDGWIENENCLSVILGDYSTPSSINENTIECYDFRCGDNKRCTYVAHVQCGKLCNEDAEAKCKADMPSSGCFYYAGCSETVSNGVWEAKCLYENITVDENEWALDLEIEGLNSTELNMSDVVDMISSIGGIEKEQVKIGLEVNDQKQIVRITVVLNNKQSAEEIAAALNDCKSEVTTREPNLLVRDGEKCDNGLLRYVKSATVVTSFVELSSAHYAQEMLLLISISTMILTLF